MLGQNGMGLVHLANEKQLEFLVSAGVDVTTLDSAGRTALHYCHNTTRLMELGVPLDVVDSRGRTALWMRARRGAFREISTLLSAGADPKLRDEEGRTVLHALVTMKELYGTVVKDEDLPSTWEHNYRFWGYEDREDIVGGIKDVVARLVTLGVDINVRDGRGNTAFHTAIETAEK